MKYFTFKELVRSEVADKHYIVNWPCYYQEYAAYGKLVKLVNNLLVPVREKFATPMIITSGYRCEELNRLVGGKDNSQHRKGEAVDFYFQGFSKKEMAAAFFEITENFDFDQLIYYKKQGFIHISYNEDNNRHQAFMK